jgi:hypothetical protein
VKGVTGVGPLVWVVQNTRKNNLGISCVSGNRQVYITLLLSSNAYPDLLATAGGNILTDICISRIGAIMYCIYKREVFPHPEVHCSSAPTHFEQTCRKAQTEQ